jgi:hypothetical protein
MDTIEVYSTTGGGTLLNYTMATGGGYSAAVAIGMITTAFNNIYSFNYVFTILHWLTNTRKLTIFTNVILILVVNVLFTPRTTFGPTHFRTSAMLKGQKLATELFPSYALNSGTTVVNIIDCAELCVKYLYCTTFSYNRATNVCRFVVGMNSTSDPLALAVHKMLKQFIHVFVILQADSGWNTYDLVAL